MPEMSGTPRPFLWPGLAEGGTFALPCHAGRANPSLIPPPVAPPPGLFQTVSCAIAPLAAIKRVPPHASTYGLDAGKSTFSRPLFAPSVEPSSPAAQQIVTPSAAAA